ncbi:PhnD/SsuA/transferrin family substrate-binding protein [Chamaesiphon sp. VAR_48_metabat_135_sub]|uniref:phosphate/phosphite/phosphonate ABC transporter substrate-binding protein n=1 Tax=Chamaesiphon sp. VAR_48_metabat_135_sub TaxID=2964699 RepID=UPI00286B7409|nr:PhnD/SsuA/transferrin family substrate-binding protein [Chamaesiphon sp. VAR_48_metabat_135_sub]
MRSIANRRLFLTWLFLSSCGARRGLSGDNSRTSERVQLTIGTLSYGMVAQTETNGDANNRYDSIKQYLEEQLQSQVQIEPAFNENKALERIAAQAWSLVFAPPGLAAIAISQYQYTALLPLEGINNIRSILVVKKDSTYQDLRSLTGKKLAIGLPGSATGYYFPLYNFYGLTLAELIVSSTPKAILEAVARGSADVGALSLQEFNTYKSEIKQAQLRILFADPHRVPPGAILVSPNIDLKMQESIHQLLKNAPSTIAQEAGFIPNGTVPDYQYTISVIDRVRSIFPADKAQTAALLRQKPVRLFKDKDKEKDKK